MKKFLVGRPGLDYLTLTTYERDVFDAIVDAANRAIDPNQKRQYRELNLKRYRGISNGSIFHGAGVQRGRSHFLVSISGGDADKMVDWLTWDLSQINCTRVDIQMTLDLPPEYQARLVGQDLDLGLWPQRRRKVTQYLNQDGLDTIYIGSRKSAKLFRLYVKPAENGRYLRMELECREHFAEMLYLAAVEGRHWAFLHTEMLKLPQVHPIRLFVDEMGIMETAENARAGLWINDDDRTWKWFNNQVMPALQRLLNSHDYNHRMVNKLERLIEATRKDIEANNDSRTG